MGTNDICGASSPLDQMVQQRQLTASSASTILVGRREIDQIRKKGDVSVSHVEQISKF